MQTQICNKCKIELDLTVEFFHKSARNKLGFSKVCKNCTNANRRLWVEKTEYVEPIFIDKCKGDAILARAKVLYSGIVSRSREKGLSLDKSILNVKHIYEWLLRIQKCECCERLLDFSFKGQNNYASPTIDRFNPDLGYVSSNTHLLCWRCNTLKNNSSLNKLEQVLSWMQKK